MSAQGRPLFGAAMIVLGMSVIGFVDNFVRVIAESIGLWQFHAMRTAIAAPVILGLAMVFGWRLRPRNWGPALGRTALLAASMLLYFSALPMAPIAQVGAGLFTSPIFVLIFSALLFGAPVGPLRVIAVLIGFCGVLLILQPWGERLSPWALAPVAAGAFYALAMILTRRRCAEEPALGLNLLFFLALGLAGVAGLAVLEVWPSDGAEFAARAWAWPLSDRAWGALLIQVAGAIVAVFLITLGYQSADTSFAALFDYTFLLSAAATAWLLWGERLDGLGLVGACLIVGAGAFIAQRSARFG